MMSKYEPLWERIRDNGTDCFAVLFIFIATFYVLYMAARFSDIVDGPLSKKTGTVSELGSKLDATANMVFTIVCPIKSLPVLAVPANVDIDATPNYRTCQRKVDRLKKTNLSPDRE